VAGEPYVEQLLRRDRAISIAALGLLSTLAWLYIISGAGLGMDANLTLLPSEGGHDMMAPPAWSVRTGALFVAMWWVMMIAMMVPSAAPTILLYARVHRHAHARGQISDGIAPIGAFVTGYLSVWLIFALAATALQWMLVRWGVLSAMTMGSRSQWLSGGILLAAGLYQFTPLKRACLSHCRSPAAFVSRHWKPGWPGALRLGMMHGGYCVGCCWLLMALLFVGGAMNAVWIAAIALLVLVEKLLPQGPWVARIAGIVFAIWSGATLLA
jgi:predicted metal-binding membrane protein